MAFMYFKSFKKPTVRLQKDSSLFLFHGGKVAIFPKGAPPLCLHVIRPGSVHATSLHPAGCPVREGETASYDQGVIWELVLQLLLQQRQLETQQNH